MTKVIAAIRGVDNFDEALNSGVEIIFELTPNIMTLEYEVKKAHSKNKKLYIHIDLAEGIGKDRYGMMHAKELGVDGIISTRTNLIRIAREIGLDTVQRFFLVDSHSISTTLDAVKASKADMIEIMPGTVSKVISRLKTSLDVPIIAGGLIDQQEEIDEAYKNGAVAISTGKSNLWG